VKGSYEGLFGGPPGSRRCRVSKLLGMLPKSSFMESANAKSYRHKGHHQWRSGATGGETAGFEVAAPHIVVVCPSCKTSFAVETAAVAALETPRFHCSRCDDVFVMKDAPSDMLPLGGVQLHSLTQSNNHARYSHSRGRSALHESLIKPSDFSLGAGSASMASFIEPNLSATPETPPVTRSEFSLLNQSLEVDPFSPSPSHRFESTDQLLEDVFGEAPQLSSQAASETITPSSTSFIVTPAVEGTRAETPSSRRFVLADPAPLNEPVTQQKALRPESPAKPEPLRNPQPLRTNPARPSNTQTVETPKTEPYRPPPPPRRQEASFAESSQTPRRFSARTQSLISMSTPIMGALALLLGLSYLARLSSQSIDALAHAITPSFMRESVQALPPSVLGVRNLKLSFEKTRNKELIPVVRGTVLNESRSTFQDVELEVIGFNGRGQIVASSRAPLRSPLNEERIANIPLETVRKLQGRSTSINNAIAGQEVAPFTIALLDGRFSTEDGGREAFDPSEVRYFSARIFSVRER